MPTAVEIPHNAPYSIGERYKIQKELGKGAYGKVFEALDTRTNEIVAIKNTLNIFETSTDALRALREISILRQCLHPNICRIRDVLEPRDRAKFNDLWIVMDYGGWDLHKVEVNAKHIGGWSEEHIRLITYQILCALLYLKHSGIVHRDIKPSNVLLKESGDAILIDFGLARQINKVYNRDNPEELISSGFHDPDKKDRFEMNDPKFQKITKDPTQHVVTRWYRAPELCMLQPTYDTPVDIWAVGCILAELLPTLDPDTKSVKPLFPGDSCFLSFEGDTLGETELKMILGSRSQLTTIFEVLGTPSEDDMKFIEQETLKRVIRGLPRRAPANLSSKFPKASPSAIDLLSKILVFDPTKRITVEGALKHPYFNECRNPDLEKYGINKVSCEFDNVSMIPDEKTQNNKLREFLLKEIALFHKK